MQINKNEDKKIKNKIIENTESIIDEPIKYTKQKM